MDVALQPHATSAIRRLLKMLISRHSSYGRQFLRCSVDASEGFRSEYIHPDVRIINRFLFIQLLLWIVNLVLVSLSKRRPEKSPAVHHFYQVGTRTSLMIHAVLGPGPASHPFSPHVGKVPLSLLPLTEFIPLFSTTDTPETFLFEDTFGQIVQDSFLNL